MKLSDRNNWILSGAVGVLLVANGLVRIPGWSSNLELVVAGALITGGLLATSNGITAIRDPDARTETDWTPRKTAINAVAVVLLSVILAVGLADLVFGGAP